MTTRAAGRPDRFQRGDHVALAIEIELRRVGDPDAADQQRREPDQRQVLREALDIAFELRGHVAAAADFPTGLRKLRLRGGYGVGDAVRVHPFRHPQPVMPAHQAAGLQQAGCAQSRFADQHPGTESETARKLVGFAGERGTQFHLCSPDRESGAGLQFEPRQQRRIGDDTENPVPFGQQCGKIGRRLGRDRPEQRIGPVHRFELDQGRTPVGRARHGPQGRGDRQLSAGRQERALGLRGLPLDQGERDVAAENDPAFTCEPFGESRSKTSRPPRSPPRQAQCRQ